MLKTQGLSHDPVAQGEPLIDTLPAGAVRRECTRALPSHLQTATALGLDHVGLPMRSAPIASLFGFAKQHGVGEIKDAGRLALRLPALCGGPTPPGRRPGRGVTSAGRSTRRSPLHAPR